MFGDNLNSNDEEPKCSGEILLVTDMVVNNDTTALHRWLVKPRKEPQLSDNQAWRALQEAASRADREECLELLIKYGHKVFRDLDSIIIVERKNALHIACEANCEGNVLLLLQKGFNPNGKTLEGMSPLHIAVDKGYSNIVTHLLNYRANVNDENYEGLTALHFAAIRINVEIGRILLENGADVQIKDHMGNLSTHLAVRNYDINFIRLIIDKKPSIIDAENIEGSTALQLAIEYANVECALYLLDRGAKVMLKMIKSVGISSTNTREVELVEQLIKHFKVDDVVNESLNLFKSITCEIINLRSVEYLSLLLESGLPKYLLQAPLYSDYDRTICTPPLVHVLNNRYLLHEIAEAMIRLLLDHDIIFMDEYFRIIWGPLQTKKKFLVRNIEEDRFRLFHQILTDKGVTVDYPLRCVCSITEICENELPLFHNAWDLSFFKLESLKFYIRNSCIVEPSILSTKLIKILCRFNYSVQIFVTYFLSAYSYLIELTPIFYLRHTKGLSNETLNIWEWFSPVADEFAKSTLKQFCRTEIRQLLRGISINDDLLNFQRRVDNLPLPTCLKNYLLFKD